MRTLQESGRRWLRGCVRAHLDGNTSWMNVLGCLRGSDLQVIRELLRETRDYGDHDRWQRLAEEFGVS